jgi:hypothetical protein
MEEAVIGGLSLSNLRGQPEEQKQGSVLSVRKEGIVLLQVPQLRL